MAINKTTEIKIDTAKPHTIKKFELIEKYVEAWTHKVLKGTKCNGLVFIDCMCNSGIYNNNILGTPIRVANYFAKIMEKYPTKKAWLLFNDLDSKKIELLKTHLPDNTNNLHIEARVGDGNELLKDVASKIDLKKNLHYLLIYDPYHAAVKWEALLPFFRNWGEVIINHMVSDTIRGASQAKSESAIEKYEQTYLSNIEELLTFGNDRSAYEKRIREIITALRGTSSKPYYIASFPFFNTTNALIYNLLHCSGNIEGFKLFKSTAWKTFGDKSSSKTANANMQLVLDVGDDISVDELKTVKDENCYFVKDIAEYLYAKFKEYSEIPLEDMWRVLDEHPIFPSDGYRNEIKKELKNIYGYVESKQTLVKRGAI